MITSPRQIILPIMSVALKSLKMLTNHHFVISVKDQLHQRNIRHHECTDRRIGETRNHFRALQAQSLIAQGSTD